ncbi:MAG: hypothetical protein ACLUB5_00965 [Bifidobacterium dentium]
MLGSFKYLLAIDPPTGTGDGSLLAVWTICLWAALLAGIFAVAEDGRLTMVAVNSYVRIRDLRAAWHVERLLPYGDRHDYGGRAGGLVSALKLLELGLAQFRSHRAAGFSAVAIGGCLWSGKTAPFCATIMIRR